MLAGGGQFPIFEFSLYAPERPQYATQHTKVRMSGITVDGYILNPSMNVMVPGMSATLSATEIFVVLNTLITLLMSPTDHYSHASIICIFTYIRVSEVDGCLPASSYISNRNLMYELAGDFT